MEELKNFCWLNKSGNITFTEKDQFGFWEFELDKGEKLFNILPCTDMYYEFHSIDEKFNSILLDDSLMVIGTNLNTTINQLIEFYKGETSV